MPLRIALTKDKNFYRTFGMLFLMIAFQNVVAFSVNMADNLMLGTYSQEALSGAATVNQIQFMVQQLTMAIGDSVLVIGSQYWGRRQTAPIRRLTGYALLIGGGFGIAVFIATGFFGRDLLRLFTEKDAYIEEGLRYLSLIRFTYPIYILSAVLMAALRTVEVVRLSLWVSLASLAVDVSVNEVLIFGRFGFPELGIRGAAIGTLLARIMELSVIVLYLLLRDRRLRLFRREAAPPPKGLFRDYCRVLLPSALSNLLWSIATPIQTSVLGHLSDDAIAANSVSTTLFQYLKIVAVSEASASAVVIGKTVGESQGDDRRIREYSRTLQLLYLSLGFLLGIGLFFLRIPLLSLYRLTPEAMQTANGMLIVLSVVMVGMAYQMPVCVGIIKGGGDVRFMMILNSISTWGIVMPLTFLGAFVWRLPAVWVVAILNSDQLFKCIPAAIRCNRYRWIHRLTRDSDGKIATN